MNWYEIEFPNGTRMQIQAENPHDAIANAVQAAESIAGNKNFMLSAREVHGHVYDKSALLDWLNKS